MDNRLSIAGAPPPARVSGALVIKENRRTSYIDLFMAVLIFESRHKERSSPAEQPVLLPDFKGCHAFKKAVPALCCIVPQRSIESVGGVFDPIVSSAIAVFEQMWCVD